MFFPSPFLRKFNVTSFISVAFSIYNESINGNHHIKEYVEIGHLTKFDAKDEQKSLKNFKSLYGFGR